jgi:hypothetical protein
VPFVTTASREMGVLRDQDSTPASMEGGEAVVRRARWAVAERTDSFV